MDRKVSGLQRLSDHFAKFAPSADHFAKFAPSAVRNLIAQNPEEPDFAKQERDASILFLDISGYARLAELLPSAEGGHDDHRNKSRFVCSLEDAAGFKPVHHRHHNVKQNKRRRIGLDNCQRLCTVRRTALTAVRVDWSTETNSTLPPCRTGRGGSFGRARQKCRSDFCFSAV